MSGYDDDSYVEVPYDNTLHETDGAVLIAIDTARSVWIPLRLLDSSEQTPIVNDHGGEHGACFVERWFAEKEGLV